MALVDTVVIETWTPTVQPAQQDDTQRVLDTLTLAFAADPAVRASATVWHNYAMIACRAERPLVKKRQRTKLPENSTHLILSGLMACQTMVRVHTA